MGSQLDSASNHIHTSETHQGVLKNLCRLCCCRAKKSKETKNCNKNKRERTVIQSSSKIKEVFGFDVGNDIPDVHPKLICTSCFNILQRDTSSERYNAIKDHVDKISHLWVNCTYRDDTQFTDCNICMIDNYFASRIRGNPKNFKPWDLPDHLTMKKTHGVQNQAPCPPLSSTAQPRSTLPNTF